MSIDNLFENIKRNYKAGVTVEVHGHPAFKSGTRGIIHAMHRDGTMAEVQFDGESTTTVVPILYLAIKKHKIEGKLTAKKTPMTAEQKKFFLMGVYYGQAYSLGKELGVSIEEASALIAQDMEVLK